MLQKMKNKKGFTLVEMIVVIAIIAILIGLIAPNVVALIRRATNTANDATAKTLQGSANVWGTNAYTNGQEFIGAVKWPTTASEYYVYKVKGGAAITSWDSATTADALFKFTVEPKDLLLGTTDEAYINTKDVRTGWTYYFYFTKLGTCGGVVVVDTNKDIVGFTQNMPSGMTIARGDLADALNLGIAP